MLICKTTDLSYSFNLLTLFIKVHCMLKYQVIQSILKNKTKNNNFLKNIVLQANGYLTKLFMNNKVKIIQSKQPTIFN